MGEFLIAQQAIEELYDGACVLADEYKVGVSQTTADFDELVIPPCDVIEQANDEQLARYVEEFGSDACRSGLCIQRLTRQVGILVLTSEFRANQKAGIRLYGYNETSLTAGNYPEMNGRHRSGKVQRNRFAGNAMPIQTTEGDFLKMLPYLKDEVRRTIRSAHELSR